MSKTRVILIADRDRLGHTFNQVAPLDLHRDPLVEIVGGAHPHLDVLGRALADQ